MNVTKEDHWNVTQGNVTEPRLRHWAWIVLLLIPLGILGNLLVIIAVIKCKKLQKYLNRELASMAVADMLVCALVIPLGATQLVYGYWVIKSDVMCVAYLMMDVTLCTSSILHMCCVSLDRYIAIAKPTQTLMYTNTRTVVKKLTAVWTISILIALFILLHFKLDRTSVISPSGQCGINNSYFQIYGSLLAFYIPMVAMSVLYGLTVHRLRRLTKHPLLMRTRGRSQNSSCKSNSQQVSRNPSSLIDEKPARFVLFRLFNSLRKNSQESEEKVTNELKAVKTLGFAFVLFVISWAPFFAFNLYQGVCPHCGVNVDGFEFTLWWGYSASAINPIIYTAVNKDFRQAFRDIMTCAIWRRQDSVLRTLVVQITQHTYNTMMYRPAGEENIPAPV